LRDRIVITFESLQQVASTDDDEEVEPLQKAKPKLKPKHPEGGEDSEGEVEIMEGTGRVTIKRSSQSDQKRPAQEDDVSSTPQRRASPSYAGPRQAWKRNTMEGGPVDQLSFLLFLLLGGWSLFLAHWLATCWLWINVVTIPMARLNIEASRALLATASLTVHTGAPTPESRNVVFWRSYATHPAMVSLEVYGTNVVMFNLNFAIGFTLFFGYVLGHHFVQEHYVVVCNHFERFVVILRINSQILTLSNPRSSSWR